MSNKTDFATRCNPLYTKGFAFQFTMIAILDGISIVCIFVKGFSKMCHPYVCRVGPGFTREKGYE